MSTLLLTACAALGEALRAAAPELADVQYVQAPPEHAATYPALAILPERFVVDPQPDDEVLDDDGDPVVVDGTTALMSAGAIRGSMRLWVAARSAPARARLEERLRAAFFQDGFANGRLLLTLEDVEVLGVSTGADWPLAFFLESAEWREELVFSERRWSFLQVEVDIPILILRKDAALVTSLLVALTTDMTTTVDDPTDVAVPPLTDLDLVAVADDGTPATP